MTPELALELVEPTSDGIPFDRVIGVTLESMSPTGAGMEVGHREELTNNPSGILHGDVVSSIQDVVGGLQALSALVFDRELDTLDATFTPAQDHLILLSEETHGTTDVAMGPAYLVGALVVVALTRGRLGFDRRQNRKVIGVKETTD